MCYIWVFLPRNWRLHRYIYNKFFSSVFTFAKWRGLTNLSELICCCKIGKILGVSNSKFLFRLPRESCRTAKNKNLLYFDLSATAAAAERAQTLITPNITISLLAAAVAAAGVKVEQSFSAAVRPCSHNLAKNGGGRKVKTSK